MTYSLVSNYSVILRIPNDLSLVLLYVQNDFVPVVFKTFVTWLKKQMVTPPLPS